ncbi:unnamed protein product, partial [Ectocarpus sp. 12 AP-2014]
ACARARQAYYSHSAPVVGTYLTYCTANPIPVHKITTRLDVCLRFPSGLAVSAPTRVLLFRDGTLWASTDTVTGHGNRLCPLHVKLYFHFVRVDRKTGLCENVQHVRTNLPKKIRLPDTRREIQTDRVLLCCSTRPWR